MSDINRVDSSSAVRHQPNFFVVRPDGMVRLHSVTAKREARFSRRLFFAGRQDCFLPYYFAGYHFMSSVQPMIFNRLQSGQPVSDIEFNKLFTERIRQAALIHFTPIAVAKLAAHFLAPTPGVRVLDIGSGAGKFCLVGATCTEGHFTGVEQRRNLYLIANRIVKKYAVTGVQFVHANILQIDFKAFDAFYFFNSFYEHIDQSGMLDNKVLLDRQLYHTYSQYVKDQLEAMPIGTRLVTYFSYLQEIPLSYQVQSVQLEGRLKLLEKRV